MPECRTHRRSLPVKLFCLLLLSICTADAGHHTVLFMVADDEYDARLQRQRWQRRRHRRLASQDIARLDACTLGPNRWVVELAPHALRVEAGCCRARSVNCSMPKCPVLRFQAPPRRRSVLLPTAVRLASRSREGSLNGSAEEAAPAAGTAAESGGGEGRGRGGMPLAQQAQQPDGVAGGVGAGGAGTASAPAAAAAQEAAGGAAAPEAAGGAAAAAGGAAAREPGGGSSEAPGKGGHQQDKKGSSWWRRLYRNKGLQWSDYRIGALGRWGGWWPCRGGRLCWLAVVMAGRAAEDGCVGWLRRGRPLFWWLYGGRPLRSFRQRRVGPHLSRVWTPFVKGVHGTRTRDCHGLHVPLTRWNPGFDQLACVLLGMPRYRAAARRVQV